MLQLMFDDQRAEQPHFDTRAMRQYLRLLDHCIAHYVTIAKEWDHNGNWDLLSPARISECDNRLLFIRKIRDVSEETIIRLENERADRGTAHSAASAPGLGSNS